MAPAARFSDGSSPSIRPVPSDQVSTGKSQAPPRPGRKKDPAWTLVDIGGDKSVWCRRCGNLIHTQGSNHITRVRRHVNETCTKLPPPSKITDTFKSKLQPTVFSVFHDAFARWIYTTTMPFYKVEHRTQLNALKVLHPGIELPSAYQLANTFLDSAFVKSIAAMEADLIGEVMTVVTDGWTDINGLAVVNYVVAAGKKTYFLESVLTGSQSNDTEVLVCDARRVISKYQFLNVGAIVTNNTAANKAMWEEIQPDFPNFFFRGCVCHALYLLVKAMVAHIPWLDKLQAECKRLVVFFKMNHKLWFRLHQLMKAKNLRVLALSGDTRWGSLLPCMSSIRTAEDVLFSVVSGQNFMEAKTKKKCQARQLVFNLVTASDFVSKLKRAVALLKFVAKPMKQLEKNETPVSDVFKLFLDLPTSIETCGLRARDVKVVKGLVKERFDFIYGDAHGFGFLLHPRYRGLGMDSTTRGNVEMLLVQWHDGDEAANAVVSSKQYIHV